MGQIDTTVTVVEQDGQFLVSVGGDPGTVAMSPSRFEAVAASFGLFMENLERPLGGQSPERDTLGEGRNSAKPEDQYELGN